MPSQDGAQTLQTLLSGVTATQAREDIRLVDVVVRATPAERLAVAAVGDLTILTAGGAFVPLAKVGRLSVETDEPILWRRDGKTVLAVRADLRDGVQGSDVTAALRPDLAALVAALPASYAPAEGGAVDESAKANAALL